MKKLFSILLILFTCLVAVPAMATIIDFDSLESPTGNIISVTNPYLEDGFSISGSPLNTFGQTDTRYAGSAGMTVGASNAPVSLTALGGSAFDAFSIDLSFIEPGASSIDSITFTGTLFAGGTVQQIFTPIQFGFATFNFDASFVNIISLGWDQNIGSSIDGFQWDNINVDMPVPEPSTIILFGFGLIGLLGLNRRKK